MTYFGTLEDVGLRTGWPHEAIDFTPWLADNLDRLGHEIGLSLSLKEVEAKLPTKGDFFSADILAETHTEDLVLIENQLEGSDHNHLGQIMTYLPALEAKVVIWIAQSFREAHLAAIKWLNEHSHEEYSFFAIQLRLVQIGDSPLAPLFDVLEKPNHWERHVQSKARAIRKAAPNADLKEQFWNSFRDNYSVTERDGLAKRGNTSWIAVPDTELVISANLTQDGIVIFVRGREGWSAEDVSTLLMPYAAELSAELKTELDGGRNNGLFKDFIAGDYTDITQHDDLSKRLADRIMDYKTALSRLSTP